MAPNYQDSVQDVSTSAGTGAFTPSGTPPDSWRPFSVHTVGDSFEYRAFAGAQWEIGDGTWTGTTITRSPRESSSGNGLVNFATAPTVWECVTAATIKRMLMGGDVLFSQTIPLSTPGTTYMEAKTVTGALTFTPAANAVRNALVYHRSTANGVNLPDVTAFDKAGGSADYVNTAGTVNIMQFFYDGVRPRVYIDQDAVTGVVVPDTTAPTLTSPTSASTGTTTGSGAVTTNEANGTLYYLASTNATETATTVKTSGATVAVTSTGSKAVTVSGLTASTQYYLHFLHRDAANNDSQVSNSAAFTTAAVQTGDTTAPTLSSPTGTQTGSTTATGSVSTNEANGTLYYLASANAVESAATIKAAASQPVTATGVQNVSFTGLAAATQFYAHFVHRDAANNDSLVANSAVFTTAAAAGGGQFLRLTTALDHLQETGSGPYTYALVNGANTFNSQGGVSAQVRPTGADAWATVINNGSPTICEMIFGVTNAANAAFGSMDYAIWTGSGVSSNYTPITGGNIGSATAVAKAAGDIIRLSFVGTTIVVEVARGATPTTWIPVYTFSGVSTASRKFAVNAASGTSFQTSTSVGLA